jgi:hypothetical protein
MPEKSDYDEVLNEARADSPDAGANVTVEAATSITDLVARQIALEDRLEALEEERKQVQAELDLVQDRQLPDAMMAAQVSRLETEDGAQVRLEAIYFPGVNKEDELALYDWMSMEGHDGIINTNILIPLGKGAHERGQELVDYLRGLPSNEGLEGLSNIITLKEDIHWATFRAWAKEQSLAGTKFPSMLKVHQVTRAKIKRKRST